MPVAASKNALTGGVVILGIAAAVWWLMPGLASTTVDVKVPELSPVAEAGQKAFRANCAQCHGGYAGGTDRGPPLIHKWYHPNHHADAAFFLAAKRGVAQHHWKIGSMPAQPQVGERSLQQIVEYVRELQRANEIY